MERPRCKNKWDYLSIRGSPLAQQRKYNEVVQLKFINNAKPYIQEKKTFK